MQSSYSRCVVDVFKQHENKSISQPMAKYMKNKFEYFGIKSPLRKEISKPYLSKKYLPPKKDVPKIVEELWNEPQRELQYFAMELLQKYNKTAPVEWIILYESLITQKSWWDTVDGLAAWQVGDFFQKYPDQNLFYTKKWMDSDNIWLQRTCLIYQLRYRSDTEFERMKSFIVPLSSHKDFFIRKAIGWALRQYGKENPTAVQEFVAQHELSNLSKREALKLIL